MSGKEIAKRARQPLAGALDAPPALLFEALEPSFVPGPRMFEPSGSSDRSNAVAAPYRAGSRELQTCHKSAAVASIASEKRLTLKFARRQGMSKHVIVIGSGIIGSSIAYHLAKQGARVTVLDEAEPGGIATRASFAWINASWGNPEFYFRPCAGARWRSGAGWPRKFPTSVSTGAVDCAGTLPAMPGKIFCATMRSWGYGMRIVDPREIPHWSPVSRHPPADAIHVAEEGVVEPLEAPRRRCLTAARGLGAELFHTHARQMARCRRRAGCAACCSKTATSTPTTLSSRPGAGAPELLASADFTLPLELPPGLLVYTEPAPPMFKGLVMAPELHVRQMRKGALVAGSDFGGSDPALSPRDGRRPVQEGPGFRERRQGAQVASFTMGYRPTPRDGLPVIGKVPSADRLYAAVMHSGITNAAAVGLFAAKEILDGERERSGS